MFILHDGLGVTIPTPLGEQLGVKQLQINAVGHISVDRLDITIANPYGENLSAEEEKYKQRKRRPRHGYFLKYSGRIRYSLR